MVEGGNPLQPWRTTRLLLGSAIAIAVLLTSVEYSVATGEDSSLVHRSELEVRKPKTDGSYVVWADRVSAQKWDVLGANLSTGEVFPVATSGDASRSDPDIDNGIVVWSEGSDACPNCERDILGLDLESGNRFTIASGAADQTRPAISGGNVLWVEDDGADFPKLRAASINNPEQSMTLSVQHSLTNRPEIDGEQVVWAEQRGFYSERDYRLVTQEIGDDEVTVIEDFDGDLKNRSDDSPFAVDGNQIVYRTDPLGELLQFNVETGVSTPLIPFHPSAGNLSTDGRYVFGHDGPSLQRGVRLRIWDTQTGSSFVAPSDVTETRADIHDGTVVWERGGRAGMRQEVHSRPISQLLPTTPQPPPVEPDTDTEYHEATGHTIAFGFKHFWESSGGLPVFGFPLTEEFDEVNQDNGDNHTVQYFERQRYEYHPEHAGTPYEVQLGRLGYEDAAAQGLLADDAFQPIDGNPGDEDQCHYFEETGFAACSEFLDYWQSHGLDFGDDGVSFRESLALFGYPISQEYFSPPGSGAEPVTIQYFERARFEFHPDNPEEHRVLLGRLGADLLEQRDW